MKTLTIQQINLIENKLSINSKDCIVLLDVMGNKEIPKEESNRNIYCVNETIKSNGRLNMKRDREIIHRPAL